MSLMINRKRLVLKTLIITIAMMLSVTSFALAYDDSSVSAWISANTELDTGGKVKLSNNLGNIMGDNPYDELSGEAPKVVSFTIGGTEQQLFMSEKAYEEIGKRSDKAIQHGKVKDKVDKMQVNFNVEADIESAGVALSGLQEVIGMLVGLLAYAIVIGMTLFTTLDICYITMPVFKSKTDEMVQRGGIMAKADSRTGEVGHRWITDDAQYAVANATIENGKAPLAIYLGKRVWSYVLLALVLFILLTGNIQLIVNIAISFISGLIAALEGLA